MRAPAVTGETFTRKQLAGIAELQGLAGVPRTAQALAPPVRPSNAQLTLQYELDFIRKLPEGSPVRTNPMLDQAKKAVRAEGAATHRPPNLRPPVQPSPPPARPPPRTARPSLRPLPPATGPRFESSRPRTVGSPARDNTGHGSSLPATARLSGARGSPWGGKPSPRPGTTPLAGAARPGSRSLGPQCGFQVMVPSTPWQTKAYLTTPRSRQASQPTHRPKRGTRPAFEFKPPPSRPTTAAIPGPDSTLKTPHAA